MVVDMGSLAMYSNVHRIAREVGPTDAMSNLAPVPHQLAVRPRLAAINRAVDGA
jgi:hypothetical protein